MNKGMFVNVSGAGDLHDILATDSDESLTDDVAKRATAVFQIENSGTTLTDSDEGLTDNVAERVTAVFQQVFQYFTAVFQYLLPAGNRPTGLERHVTTVTASKSSRKKAVIAQPEDWSLEEMKILLEMEKEKTKQMELERQKNTEKTKQMELERQIK